MKTKRIKRALILVFLLFVSQEMSVEAEEFEQIVLLQQYLSEGTLTVCILNANTEMAL